MSEAREPTDGELARGTHAGDETVVRVLFERHPPALRAAVRAVIESLSEDSAT